MLVDLARPIVHAVERFLVRRITDYDDVVCCRLSVYPGILNWRGLLNTFSILLTSSLTVIVFELSSIRHVGLDTVTFSLALTPASGARPTLPTGCCDTLRELGLQLTSALLEDTLLGEWVHALSRGHHTGVIRTNTRCVWSSRGNEHPSLLCHLLRHWHQAINHLEQLALRHG